MRAPITQGEVSLSMSAKPTSAAAAIAEPTIGKILYRPVAVITRPTTVADSAVITIRLLDRRRHRPRAVSAFDARARAAGRSAIVGTRRRCTASGAPGGLPHATARGASRRSRRSVVGPSLLGVGLILALRAVADRPDVAVRVREGTAVPAPSQGGSRLEDRGAGRLGLGQDLVDPRLAPDHVGEDQPAEAAALRAHPDHLGQTVAAVEADERPTARHEEDRDPVVPLDLPAETLGVEPLGPVHVPDAEEDRAHVRVHFLSPLLPIWDRFPPIRRIEALPNRHLFRRCSGPFGSWVLLVSARRIGPSPL